MSYLTNKMKVQLTSVNYKQLTSQELQILQMLSKGNSQIDIAKDLNLSLSIVEKTIIHLKTEFNAKNTPHLIKIVSDLKAI